MTPDLLDPTIRGDAVLPEDIKPEQATSEAPFAAALLTGASGFLGIFVLADLLTETTAHVYCLVRSGNPGEGQKRLEKNATRYGLALDWSRISCIPGDFSEANLGLNDADYKALADKCDIVYHVGAAVSFAPSYAEIRNANIVGTIEMLRFACSGRLKPVHYVSTYAVFNEESYVGQTLALETPVIGTGRGFKRAYAQTKWLVELLCAQAQERGIPVSIYRAGIISGNTRDGCCNPSDLMSLIFYTVQELGIAQDTEFLLHLTPVDYCSQALVRLSLKVPVSNQIYHLVTPKPIRWQAVVEWLNADCNPIQKLPPKQWYEEIKRQMLTHRYLMPLYFLLQFDPNRDFWCSSSILHMQFDEKHVRTTLGPEGPSCPEITPQLLQKYFGYLKQHGRDLFSPAQ